MPSVSDPSARLYSLQAAAPASCVDTGLRGVRVTGADATSFLQGQFTANLDQLEPNQHLWTAWCTGKGRVWTMLRVWRDDAGFGLLLPSTLRERFVARLQMFVLRADVQLSPIEPAACGVLTDRAEGKAGELIRDGDQIELILAPSLRLRIGTPPSEHVEIDADFWTGLLLLAGEAQIGPDTQERFLPQALGLSAGHGLDFNKGCYVGQEIVARVHYRGRCPERLALFEDPSDTELEGRTVLADVQAGGIRLVQVVEKVKA